MIADASAGLVTQGSQFRHSFEVAIGDIDADPQQPRKLFAESEIAGLAASMTEQGQLQPILLRRDPAHADRWIIVAGERRWRAAQSVGWTTLLAIETDGDPDVVTILENLQRVDLSPIEEARGLQRLITRKNWSQDRVAAALGKSKSEISAALRILTLPDELLDVVLTSELPLARNTLVELSRLDVPTRNALLARVGVGALTVQAIRAARPTSNAIGTRPRHVQPLARRLDEMTAAIEAANHCGATLDAATCEALQRLQNSVNALLRAMREARQQA